MKRPLLDKPGRLFSASAIVIAVAIPCLFYKFFSSGSRNTQNPSSALVEKVENTHKKFSIDNSNVWALTAGDYVKMRGKELKDYEISTLQFNTEGSSKESYMKGIPNNVEAITDLKEGAGYTWIGTALVPKEKAK